MSTITPIDNDIEQTDITQMNISECVGEYLSLQVHLQKLRSETRKHNKRLNLIQSRMCNILKENNKTKIDVNREFSFIRDISTQQVPFTKKNIRTTLEKNITDTNTVDKIYTILTEKRDTIIRERLVKKKYRER